MRFLGIDYGSKKVGLALSDESGRLAFPHKFLINSGRLIAQVAELCRQEKVGRIIIGQSLDYQGRDNPIMPAIRKFKAKLEKVTGLEIVFESEFLTTKQASRSQSRPGKIDSSAAAIILQSFLDRPQ